MRLEPYVYGPRLATRLCEVDGRRADDRLSEVQAAREGPRTVSTRVHIAGEPSDVEYMKQLCTRCGLVMIDNTGWIDGGVAVLDDDDRGPGWWATDAFVRMDGGCSFMIGLGTMPPDADVPLCGDLQS